MIAVAGTIAVSVAVGVALERRFGRHARTAARGLLTTILYVVLPPVTFLNVARLHVDEDVAGGIGLAYVALALTGLVAWLVSRRVLRLSRPATGSVINAAILANTGYLGLPLTVALLGGSRLGEALAYDSLVGAPVLFVAGFGVGAAFGRRAGEGTRERLRSFVFRNPPLVAALLGLAAPESLAPEVLVRASHTVILSILPFGFLALGAILTAEAEEEAADHAPAAPGGAVALGCALRLLLAPALLAALAEPLIDLPAPYLLLAATSCGINSLAVAHVYGLDVRISAAVIAWTTAAVVAAGLVAALLV